MIHFQNAKNEALHLPGPLPFDVFTILRHLTVLTNILQNMNPSVKTVHPTYSKLHFY